MPIAAYRESSAPASAGSEPAVSCRISGSQANIAYAFSDDTAKTTVSDHPIAVCQTRPSRRGSGLLDLDVVVGMRGLVRDQDAQPRQHREQAQRAPHPHRDAPAGAVGDRNRDERRKQGADRHHGRVERRDEPDAVGEVPLHERRQQHVADTHAGERDRRADGQHDERSGEGAHQRRRGGWRQARRP